MPRRFLAHALLVGTTAFTVGSPLSADEPSQMLATFGEQVIALNQALAQAPHSVSLYSQRGDRHLFLGRFAAAVADFERMITLDPAQDAPHWRLGIAYHFNGQFAQAAKQFEKYHAHDGRDRENGIWKFLGDEKVLGLARARRGMLAYTRFDREPFPSLYEMFAGKATTAEFLDTLKTRNLADDPQVMFFANYYAGLNEEILGRHEQALALLRAAVASPWGRSAEDGPAYMWQVARLHYAMLAGPN